MRTVIALFEDLAEARRTAKDLAQSGLSLDRISVVSPETAPTSGTADLPLDTMNVAGVGEVAACGPMIEYMRSAAATEPGTLADVLVRMGLSDQDAQRFVDGIKHGYTLESAIVDDDKAQQTHQIMQEHLAAQGRKPTGGTEAQAAGDTQTNTQASPGTEAAKAAPQPEPAKAAPQPEPAKAEAAADMGAGATTDQRGSTDEVRGSAAAGGETAPGAAFVEEEVVEIIEPSPTFDLSSYSDHFRDTYGSTAGSRIEEYEPAYRFGAERRGDLAGSDWSSVESKAQAGWEEKNPGTWERFKGAIKHAWERAKEEIKG